MNLFCCLVTGKKNGLEVLCICLFSMQISFLIGNSTLYHLCGDNIDMSVKQQYMRIGSSKPDSIHYFHFYAVADRIGLSNISDQVIATQQRDSGLIVASLLPTPEDDVALRDNICVLMSRILCEHVEFFKFTFEEVVDWHIKHEFYDEMSPKSIVVSIINIIFTFWTFLASKSMVFKNNI